MTKFKLGTVSEVLNGKCQWSLLDTSVQSGILKIPGTAF